MEVTIKESEPMSDERQADSIPDCLSRRVAIYQKLIKLGLSREDIQFVIETKLD